MTLKEAQEDENNIPIAIIINEIGSFYDEYIILNKYEDDDSDYNFRFDFECEFVQVYGEENPYRQYLVQIKCYIKRLYKPNREKPYIIINGNDSRKKWVATRESNKAVNLELDDFIQDDMINTKKMVEKYAKKLVQFKKVFYEHILQLNNIEMKYKNEEYDYKRFYNILLFHSKFKNRDYKDYLKLLTFDFTKKKTY